LTRATSKQANDDPRTTYLFTSGWNCLASFLYAAKHPKTWSKSAEINEVMKTNEVIIDFEIS